MTQAPTHATSLDLREKGAAGQTSERRLFLQLQVFTGCREPQRLSDALQASGLEAVLYLDVNDPAGVAFLFMAEAPEAFTGPMRAFLLSAACQGLQPRPELTMLGRTYSTGFEPELEDWLLQRPRRHVRNPASPWAIWYPLRRKPEFALLTAQEQGSVLREHGTMGRAYGDAGVAADVRLACHGLDARDNDFVIGLIGPQLHPLSHLVQEMRKSQQTAKYLQSLGPFFVGRAFWQSPL